jgi:BioD-like phosphotransacetylase family protein
MTKVVLVTSTRTSAGKTTVGLGLALAAKGTKVGYLKPFGDRLVYRKKALLDADAVLFRSVLGAPGAPEGHCLGFDYEMLWKQRDKGQLDGAVKRHLRSVSVGRDIVLVESACNFSFGRMARLDSLSLASELGAEVVLVADGSPGLVYDKCSIFSECADDSGVAVRGLVINKVSRDDEKEMAHVAKSVEGEFGYGLLGCVPELPLIGDLTMETVSEKLSAKVLAGSQGLASVVKKVRVGAMSAESAIAMRAFHEPRKLIITGGDRVDFVLLALESDTSGIILTNGVIPHSNILAKAEERDVPILSVQADTYSTAKMVERIVPEVKPHEEAKIAEIERGIKKHVDVKKALGL